jgi:predicted ATPase
VNPIRERARLPFWGVDSPAQSINIVEQPELHLHPRMQAKLTDLYARLATSYSNTSQSYFILETHSETIVNRLGELIYHNLISKDDIVVLLVSRSGGSCSVSPSSYGSDGILQEWPYGFFLPDQLSENL